MVLQSLLINAKPLFNCNSSDGAVVLRDALEKVPLRLQVSEPITLSLQKSAKSRSKKPNSLRSNMRIFTPDADSCKLRVTTAPANAI